VLTGEDAHYFEALGDGADGGILAAAHVETARFAEIRNRLAAARHDAALALWRSLEELTRLLFAEPSPAPIKYWLWRSGLIDSAQVRLPMTEVSEDLAARIDQEIERRKATSTGVASSAVRKFHADSDTSRPR
jgi:4-hydroxy-tetrahydrodipicolinate synthase